MELSREKRIVLGQGLDYCIMVKESEIEAIKSRTEDDYKIYFRFMETNIVPVKTLETLIQEDVDKVQNEIEELRKLKHDIDSGENTILFVPKSIQINLNFEQKY